MKSYLCDNDQKNLYLKEICFKNPQKEFFTNICFSFALFGEKEITQDIHQVKCIPSFERAKGFEHFRGGQRDCRIYINRVGRRYN